MGRADEPVKTDKPAENEIMKTGTSRSLSSSISLISGIGILVPLFFIPVGMVLIRGFSSGTGSAEGAAGVPGGVLMQQLSSPYVWRITYFTLKQAFWSTAVSLLIALPGAYLLSHYQFFGKRLLKALSVIPFILPPILVVLGFVIFYGNSGYINTFLMRLFSLSEPPLRILYSFKAIILAHSFYNFPIILRIVSSYWEELPNQPEHAAYSLGAGAWRTFFTVTLPRLIPSIISSASLVFLFCFTSFAVILVLGGGPRFTTLEVEIYRQARVSMNVDTAAALTIISLLFSISIFLIYHRIQKRYAVSGKNTMQHTGQQQAVSGKGRNMNLFNRALITGYSVLLLIFLVSPILSVIITSFQEPVHRTQGVIFSLKWYKSLFTAEYGGAAIISGAFQSILTSFAVAAAAALLTAPLAVLLSYGLTKVSRKAESFTEILFLLPMMVSSVILGLGYFLTAKTLREWGFSSVYVMIISAHVIITFPFIFRTIHPFFQEIHSSYAPAAYALGASPLKSLMTVELPVMRSTLISGMVFVFAISMGEFNATLILSNSQVETIPITMYRLIGAYNFYGACALGTILMLSSLGLFYLFDTSRKSGSRFL